jgi:hypothetical protein
VIAAFASWHESHEAAVAVMGRRPWLPAACALEAYSVLTRLPAPNRAPPDLVRDFLVENFEGRLLAQSGSGLEVVAALVERGVSGGAAYDGAIALAVQEAGRTLLTLDRRAQVTYHRLGIEWRGLEMGPEGILG